MQSLCESCGLMRAIISGKGSRFLLCQLASSNPEYAKYPRQPMLRCEGYQPLREKSPSGEKP